jgi:ADP-heptose:LPS heptosyltransferase
MRMKHQALWQYGGTTIAELVALYEQCSLWMGNDGGPKHLAVAAGTPSVTVYRKQLGGVWSDDADGKQVVVNSGAPTLETLGTDTVLAAAMKALG